MVSCEEVNWSDIENLVVILSKKILELPQNFSKQNKSIFNSIVF